MNESDSMFLSFQEKGIDLIGLKQIPKYLNFQCHFELKNIKILI